mmetsp:Transcript_7894/g.21741  ORF Transcript_7894/g.21741 Transcript_7894/m.21741 type:complete len:478 (-) Transcript_7894:615-2048(-)|eukprot:CAMPEP_0194484892 /NCGR_PEP_ID=MMETSP0253-20130528/6069_1 /TAXON_ID=2966 /ORGANISM="Noctiluca scintillans" /LENGTH=477 /DNA_ID=CAMNT_0039324771 /DNA_START=33 /DNA_END=1466 /DNA_ORIENTATION=-
MYSEAILQVREQTDTGHGRQLVRKGTFPGRLPSELQVRQRTLARSGTLQDAQTPPFEKEDRSNRRRSTVQTSAQDALNCSEDGKRLRVTTKKLVNDVDDRPISSKKFAVDLDMEVLARKLSEVSRRGSWSRFDGVAGEGGECSSLCEKKRSTIKKPKALHALPTPQAQKEPEMLQQLSARIRRRNAARVQRAAQQRVKEPTRQEKLKMLGFREMEVGLPLPPPTEIRRDARDHLCSSKLLEAPRAKWQSSFDGCGLTMAADQKLAAEVVLGESANIGKNSKASLPQADFLSRPASPFPSTSKTPASGAVAEVADAPDWQEVVFSLTEQLSDKATTEKLHEFKRFAEKEGSMLSAQLKKERASKEGKCRRTNQFRASPKLLDLQRIERTLASKKEYAQAAVIQKQAAALEATEREKHSSDLGGRLSILDKALVEKELEAARSLKMRMLEKLWAMALEHSLPFGPLHQVCAEVQAPVHA